MRQIVGCVLVKGTNAPVPNLVVTAFDAGGAPHVIREKGPTAEVMRHLGRRISSTLTAADGRFTFPAEDLDFPGNEPRPDLVAVVFAPEDVDNPSLPYPKPPEDRVLYLSAIPRIDAGARETFVIRLSRAVVANLQLEADVNHEANSLDHSWRARDAIAESLKNRQKADMERRVAARRAAVELTKNLQAVPRALRNNRFLVVGKAALNAKVEVMRGTSVTKLAEVQHAAIDEGLADLDKRGYKPTMRLYLNEGDLKDLNLEMKDGVVSGNLDNAAVAQKLLALTGGVDLVRRRGLNNPSPDELEMKYLVESRTAPPVR
jgi:hypothetical protein